MNIYDSKEIVGLFPTTSEIEATSVKSNFSSFSISFDAIANNLLDIVSAKFCVMTVDEVKIFVGIYRTNNGFQNTFVQIPLVGQSISSLVAALNKIVAINAVILNGYYDTSTTALQDTALTDALNKNIYFNANVDNTYITNEDIKNSIQLYYTSVEPFADQNNFYQSYGGYISNNRIFNDYRLQDALGVYDDTLILDLTASSWVAPLTTLYAAKYIQINDEIIKINSWQNNLGIISERNVFETPLRMHPSGSRIAILDKTIIFDKNIGFTNKQYRCYAVKNSHPTYIIKDLQIYFSITNRNVNSQFKIAIETPKSEIYQGVSNSSGITAFSVSSLINYKPLDYYKNAPVQFTSGLNNNQIRLIKSYVPSTGTLELSEKLPYTINQGDKFTIGPQPSTRMKSFYIEPLGSNISEFTEIFDENTPISLMDLQKNKENSNLMPNEIFYLWIERSIGPQSDEYMDNRISLSFSFNSI